MEKVAAGLQFTEGPVWSREGFLLFSDVPTTVSCKLTPGRAQPGVFRDDSMAPTAIRSTRRAACTLARAVPGA